MQCAKTSLGAFVRYLLVAVAMASVMPALSPFTGTALAAPGVTIPDNNLRAVLEAALDKSAGDPIFEAELAGLTQLFPWNDKSITDLTGLELCTNLSKLNLGDNNSLNDISPLAGLTNLESLNLKGNELNSAVYISWNDE